MIFFSVGGISTWGSLIDSPTLFIKDDCIIIQGWPSRFLSESRFKEIIHSKSHVRFYIDEHPQYSKRGQWYWPFQRISLPCDNCSYGRSRLFLKWFKGCQLIIETDKYLMFFCKNRKTIYKMYTQLMEWKAFQQEQEIVKRHEQAFLKIEDECF